jgi:NarL family two-component system sensor histidine kinase LiaS
MNKFQSASFFTWVSGKEMQTFPNSARSIYNNPMNDPRPGKKRFQQLRWRLTLTYTGVTLAALLTVELILLGIVGIGIVLMVNSGFLPAQLIEAVNADYAPILRFYLEQSPPDQSGISDWLEGVGSASSVTLPLSFDATDEMLVVGKDGSLIGFRPVDLLGSDLLGQPFDGQAVPGLAAPLQAALSGTKDTESLYFLDEIDQKVIFALPIWDEAHQQVLGVLVAIGELPTVISQLGEVLPILGVSALIFTIIAALAGTVYGFLAARGPVERLNRLSEASIAWSQGDFSTRVEDSSGDELGQLARRLNEMSQELQELLDTRRELAVIEERNRLARDLHDSAKQQAFAAAGQISAAQKLIISDPEAAETHIQEAKKLTLALRQELTNLIQQLRPAALEGKGLPVALNEYCEEWSRQNLIKVELRVQRQRQLPFEIEQAVFRILQEALANVSRHSNASQVDIDLIYSSEFVTCNISDNGVGFDLGKKGRGFGLRSMAERAAAIDSNLEMMSEKGAGTSISLIVPVRSSIVIPQEELNE